MRKIALMLAALVAVSAPSLAEAKGKKAAPAKQVVQDNPNGRFAQALGDLLTSLSRPAAPAKPVKGKKKG
jgi:hypothetical protein